MQLLHNCLKLFLLLISLHQFWCLSFDPPLFTGSVQKQSAHQWSILTHADQIECKFRHDPIRFSRAKNGTIQVIVDKNNTPGQNQKGELRLRFNQVIIANDASGLSSKKNKTLIDVPVNSSYIKYPLPETDILHTGYILKGSIKINTLELSKSQVYSCCVEDSDAKSTPSCAFIRFNHATHEQLESDMFSYYKVLYKVIIILLITIFVLLLFMLVVCIRFTDDDYYNFWTRRTPRTTIRSPSAPQLFTVSVPGQASMPKLNLVSRGDLYDRYNINANISVVDETAANTSGELPPPPPYTPPYTEYAVVSPNRH